MENTNQEIEPIVYVLRNQDQVFAKTTSFSQIERLRQEVKSLGKTAWVDLETRNGQPHPIVLD